jgi:hypothetical protein
MKTKIYLLAATLFAATTLQAQTTDEAKKAADEAAANLTKSKADMKEGWTKGGTVNFSITQGGQNKYWSKGGNSFAFGAKAIIDYNFDQKKGKTTWLNSFRARYGGITTSTYDSKTDITTTIPFAKNDDYLNFNSTYGKEFRKNWSFAGFFGLESQFEDAFLSPGYIKFGPGFLYKPNAHFSMLMSPLMAQLTTKLKSSLKDEDKFGVDAGKSVALGLGAFIQANANYDLAKGVNYKSTTTLYSNYLKNPGNIVFDMNNLFTFTVNKYIGATLIVNARYNHEEVVHLQLQESIGIGLNYKL